jgi:hypothetical protein
MIEISNPDNFNIIEWFQKKELFLSEIVKYNKVLQS